jgi:hypothetical protein
MEPGPGRKAEQVVNDVMSGFLDAGHEQIGDATFRTVIDRIADADRI